MPISKSENIFVKNRIRWHDAIESMVKKILLLGQFSIVLGGFHLECA